jgi:biopolymer transport protein ExbD
VIHVAADGILSTNGRSIPGDELKAYLAEMTGDWADQGIRLENVEVDLRIDPRVSTSKLMETLDTFFKLGITHVRWGIDQGTQPDSEVSVEDPRPMRQSP